MIENPISSTSLYNQCSTLNYTQAAMMGLTGSSIQDSQQLGYGNHGNIPNIILTGSSTSSSARTENRSGSEASSASAHSRESGGVLRSRRNTPEAGMIVDSCLQVLFLFLLCVCVSG